MVHRRMGLVSGFVMAFSLACAPAPSEPEPTRARPNELNDLPTALLFLDQAEDAIGFARHEAVDESDYSEAINYAIEGCGSLHSAAIELAELKRLHALGASHEPR